VQIPAAPELLARIARLSAGATVLTRLSAGALPPVALVGGAVRDLLLGEAPIDLDLVVEGPLDELVARLGGDWRAHERFGTAQVLLGGHRVDIASARTEVYAQPGALPEVAPATLEDDLERRDFTINAVAVRLNGPDAGAFLSVPDAVDDLAAGTLRVLHTGSFRDDPTRLLRLARYAARLHFGPEPQTLGLLAAAIREHALATVSGTRIGNELRLAANEPDPVLALAALRELGLDRAIEPGFGLTDDAWAARALELLGSNGRRDLLVLALAVRRLGPARAAALLDELAFVAEDRDPIVQAAGASALSAAMDAATRPSELAAVVGRAGPEAVALAGALGPAHAAQLWLSELRFVGIAVDGHDLLAAGVPAGPAIGLGLAAALDAARDGDAPDRETQLEVALRAARHPAVR
jgi:tRNA nucleotidyltransferase (CCA-adding enzyme)